MAHGEDTERELAECRHCGDVHPVWLRPDADIQAIGRDSCGCGSSEFDVLTEEDAADPSTETDGV